jgi:hypothetical protein
MRTDLRKAHGIGCLPIHVKKYPDIWTGSAIRAIGPVKLSFFTLCPQQDDTEKKRMFQRAASGKIGFNYSEIICIFKLLANRLSIAGPLAAEYLHTHLPCPFWQY